MKNNKFILKTGTDDFKKLISSDELIVDPNYLFVDKTMFVKEFLENGAEVILVTRPRRWGKTLALSMLRYFLEKEVDRKPTAGLFKDLKISEHITLGSILEKYQGNYPVILVSFKDLKGNTFETIQKKIIEKIRDLFFLNKYLLTNSEIKNLYELDFKNLQEGVASFERVEQSIFFLSKLLYMYHGKKVFILIDEYDNVINNSYDNHELCLWLTNFFSALFGSALKGNQYLEKGLVTGVLRIAKAGMFSGLNNLIEISILDDRFSDSYGFTESETIGLLEKAEIDNFDEIKSWYNGYIVGNYRLYNPWSITQFISNNGKFKPYWVDTANPKMLRNILLDNSISEERIKIGDLLRSNELVLENEIHASVSMEDLNFDVTAMWALMLHAGYLTFIKPQNYFKVCLPNVEIKKLIQKDINNWFTENKILSDAANALLFGNIESFSEALREALLNKAYSGRIFGGGGSAARTSESISAKEFMYQFLVMAELRCINLGVTSDYEVIAEPQAISLGQTRPDFIVIHHKKKFCIVGEIKITNRKETLEAAATRALAQIDKNQYGKKYEEEGYKLIKLGISFSGVEFEIEWK